MLKRRWSIYALLGVSAALAALTIAPAQQRITRVGDADSEAADPNAQRKGPYNQIEQQFPVQGPARTAWKIRWRTESGAGLIIQDAFFKKSPREPYIQILGEARLGEAFVPYHRGSPRFWDVSYNFPLCTVTQADAGAHGKLLSPSPGQAPTVVQELRDAGLAYKDSSGVRRGQELALWGTLSAANYRYVIEYSFRDDGLIRFRLGSTGHNYPGSEWEPHMHNAMWRLDVNLDGPNNNSVEVCEHLEPDPRKKKSQATTAHKLIDKEGAVDFDANKFTMLRVLHTQKKNDRKQPWSYDLVPYRMGNARHFGGDKEACTHHDFWVTKNRPGEIQYTRIMDYINDPQNPQQPEDVRDTDVVLWYSAPGHHEPRSEDGEMSLGLDGRRSFHGVTPIMWSTFELRPRDFWDRSPFFQ